VSARFTRLLPDPAGGLAAADVAGAIPPPDLVRDAGRPFVALNMIATADGRATIGGRTAAIANPADNQLFHALRTRVDAIMIGAGTARIERYGRLVRDPAGREARVRAGLSADPPAVLVSRSLRLPADLPLLATPENHVIVLTPSPRAELPPCAARVSYVREAGLAAGLERLRSEHGIRSVLCEGGPELNGSLLPGGLVDELHLVLAARLAAGPDPLTIVSGPALDPPLDLELLSLHESGGFLFARYALRAPT
jgi:riboflavin biosynthesis pyrimidine reductase